MSRKDFKEFYKLYDLLRIKNDGDRKGEYKRFVQALWEQYDVSYKGDVVNTWHLDQDTEKTIHDFCLEHYCEVDGNHGINKGGI